MSVVGCEQPAVNCRHKVLGRQGGATQQPCRGTTLLKDNDNDKDKDKGKDKDKDKDKDKYMGLSLLCGKIFRTVKYQYFGWFEEPTIKIDV